jgi:hypothetical protein
MTTDHRSLEVPLGRANILQPLFNKGKSIGFISTRKRVAVSFYDIKKSGNFMKTIWKFELTPNRMQSIPLPLGAQILNVQTKGNDAPLMWVLVDPDMPSRERHLGIYTTNTAVPDEPGRYIGTFLIYEGSLEFHLFEMAEQPQGEEVC